MKLLGPSAVARSEPACHARVVPLLAQIDAKIARVTADGAYDGSRTYARVSEHGDDITVIIPLSVTAVLSDDARLNPSQRDKHIALIEIKGRLGRRKKTGYGQRSLVETAIGRYKAVIGPCLRARSFLGQRAEAAVGVAVLNRMLTAARPSSVRCTNSVS